MNWRLAKNAFANLCRGGAAAVTAMVLPPILIRHMPAATYAVWVLALQAAAYLGYLDFGLQTAVGRYVAFADERKDEETRDAIFSTAVAGLSFAAVLGVLVVLVVAFVCQRIFPAVPDALLGPLRWTMVIIGISVASGLPASAWSGVAAGIQRYDIPAIAIGCGKLASAAGLIIAAVTGQSLTTMGCILGSINIGSYAAQFLMVRRAAPQVRFRPELITGPIIRELFGYCASLTVWSFSMLLVSGFDVLLVGRFQFGAVAPYSVSATLITFLAGIQTAVFGVIMPHAATLHAQENPEALGRLLVRSTRVGLLLLLLTGLPLIYFARPVIGHWIGAQFANEGGKVLAILVFANMIRLTGVPYSTLLVSTGQQGAMIVSPLAEGITNIGASIVLGIKYGATGVATATLIGAIIAVLANLFYNMPRTRNWIAVSQLSFLRHAFLLPLACAAPILFVMAAKLEPGIVSERAAGIALLVSVAGCTADLLRSLPVAECCRLLHFRGRQS